jgi:DMSO/TMAO reductase YedYZ molybdopterin-dependent catalytic subunit
MIRLSRRECLALALTGSALAGKRQLGSAPIISVQDFGQYPAILTPETDFFVRNHFDTPSISLAEWRLRVGAQRDLAFSLSDLEAFPRSKLTAVIECAGNGVGVGAVGCAEWSGIELREILRCCGLSAGAKFVRVTGADQGRETDSPEIQYSRILTMDNAMRPETLLALRMEGEPLSREHGAPARIVAAGRYGMDSVKWIQRIDVLEKSDDSFYMAKRFRRVLSGVVGQSVGPIAVKSNIVNPIANSVLRGEGLSTGGFAWAGRDSIAKVEIRIDGAPWETARLLGEPKPLSWIAWQYDAHRLRPGAHMIEVRALSTSGKTQPEQRDPLRDDAYELNQIHQVRFFTRP